jgi:hypothetical protein
VFSADAPRTIVVTFDGAAITVASDGRERMYRFRLSPTAVLAGLNAPLRAEQLVGPPLLFLALALGPAGFLLSLWTYRRAFSPRRRVVLVATGSLGASLGLEAALTAASGGLLDWQNVILGYACCAAGALGVTLITDPLVRGSHDPDRD